MSAVATAIIVGGVAGSAISGNAASKAQQAANNTNAQIAQDTNAQNWNQYLLSRGINAGGLPGVASGAVNTVLPLGFTLNGQPAEQALFNRIMQAGGLAPSGTSNTDINYGTASTFGSDDAAYRSLIPAFTSAGSPGAEGAQANSPAWNDAFNTWTSKLMAASGADTWGGIKSFLVGLPQEEVDKIAGLASSGGADAVQAYLNPIQPQGTTDAGAAIDTSTLGLGPQYDQVMQYGPQTLDQLYGGDFLAQQQAAQGSINEQRLALAATVQQAIDEQRKKFGDLNTGQLSDLDRILSTNTAGSKGIYDASLLQADTYSNAVQQATANELQRQRAARALAGFVGEGSGDALLRARTLATGFQAAGGARAQAGVEQAGRLYDINNNDVTQRFNVNSSYLQALAQLLDANGAAANAQAGVQNATDNASVLNNDIQTRLSNIGSGGTLAGQRLQLDSAASAAKFNDINNLLTTLGFFRQNQPATPGVVTPQVGSVLGGGATLGAGLSSAASGLGQYYQNQQLINALKGMGNTGGGTIKGIPVVNTPATASGPGWF